MKPTSENNSQMNDIEKWAATYNLNKFSDSISNFSNVFGLASGPIASLVVFPYAKDFGTTLIRNILKIKSRPVQIAAGLYFGATGTLAVSSFASLACAEVYSDIVGSFSNTNSPIKSKNFIDKMNSNSVLGASSFAGAISALPTSYLTYQAYRPILSRYTMPLALFTQFTWSIVQTWSIYYLSKNLWQTVECQDPESKIHQRRQIANKFKTAENNLRHMPEPKFYLIIDNNGQVNLSNFLQLISQYADPVNCTQSLSEQENDSVRSILSYIGIAIGVVSSCFFYPMGKQAGLAIVTAIVRSITVRQANLIAHMVGGSSFLASSFCFAYTTKDFFEEAYNSYLNSHLPKTNNERSDAVIDPYIVFLLSLSASAHRVTMTAKYINSKTLVGSAIIATSATSLVCTNYWSINNFSQKLHTKLAEESYTASQVCFFKLTKAFQKTIINDMSDEHLSALSARIKEMECKI